MRGFGVTTRTMGAATLGSSSKAGGRRRKGISLVLVAALLLALLAAALVGGLLAAPDANAAPRSVLIVAPHPDDEVLYGAGVTARALAAGAQVTIVYMTNGDYYDGPSGGLARQNDAVNAQTTYIGTTEDDLIFLGYPDGGLATILSEYSTPGSAYMTDFGVTQTYGTRGLGGSDYHLYKFGAHADYNAPDVRQDLESILSDYKPDDIYTTGPYDEHPDHNTTYEFVKQAIQARKTADPSYAPTLHTTMVHWQDSLAWPLPADPQSDMTEPAGLETQTPLKWNARESLVVPTAMQDPDLEQNPKFRALEAYDYTDAHGFLGWFVHRDEIFWIDGISPAGNHAPAAYAGADQSVNKKSSVTLDGSASSDPDGDPLTYAWTQTGGPTVSLSSAGAQKPTFTAPASAASLTFQLVVDDGETSSSADTVTITVGNRAPTADAGADQSVNKKSSVTLDGSASSDPDGDPLTYAWTQTGGPTVSLSSASAQKPTFTAPASAASLTFQLVVDDGETSSSADTVTITVGNRAPTADAGADQSVNKKSSVTLDGSASSDPDGDPLTYAWTQTGGPTVSLSSASAQKPTFTAPASAASLTFQLVVDDGETSSSADTVTITVGNRAPTADAGADQSVNKKSSVTLDGSASSDPDGDPLTYAWTQTGGPTVSLSSAGAQKPTFTAPASAASLTFQLVVDDGETSSSADTVTITVGNRAPTADAGADQSVNKKSSVTLDGSASSDPDGDPLTYAWTQTGGPTVSLSSASAQKPTFTAPASAASLTFQLVVDDGETSSSADTVTITVTVPPKVALGRPAAPPTVKRRHRFTVYGSLSPRHKAGKSTVTVKAYVKSHGKWVLKKKFKTKNADHKNATRYKARIVLNQRGAWRLVASYSATAAYSATTSKARYIRVK